MSQYAGSGCDSTGRDSKMTAFHLTPKDEELLALLRVNAREPVAALARKLGVSRTTVQDRLKRLEQAGIVAGYAVRLAEDVAKGGIRAYVTVEVEPRRAIDVGRALQKMPQVETLHTVSGKYDLIAMVRTKSAEDMDRMLDAVGAIAGVTGTESAVILSTKVDRR
jgi:DNA-binding Lrp family transcriptional regulator